MNELTANVVVDLEKNFTRGLDELKHEINQAYRAQQVTLNSYPQPSTQLQLEFRAKTGNEDVACKLVDDHTVDVHLSDKLMDGKLSNVDDPNKTVVKQMQELDQALNEEMLKSGAQKKNPRKRAGECLSNTGAEKIPKLMQEEATNVNVKIEKANASQIHELERALDRNEDNPRIRCLVEEVAKTPDLPPNMTMRLLKFCLTAGDRDVARQVLDNQTVNINTREGGELLWLAIERDQDHIATMLVRHGADLTVRKFDDDRTLLHHMVRSFKTAYDAERQDLFRLILEHGADVNAHDKNGHRVLHVAIVNYYRSHRMIEDLVKRGAKITINKMDRSLDDLSLACKSDFDLLLILIRVPDEETRNERAIIAIERLLIEYYSAQDKPYAVEMIGRILDLGVNVNVTTIVPDNPFEEGRYSLLDKALWLKRKEAIKLLLDHGIDPHQKGMFGHTPLYRATSFKGYTYVSRWLIEKGASIHERNDNGRYPIHGACENQSLRNLHLLLNLGADLNSTDSSGRTPFGVMKMRETLKYRELHHLIIKHFALIIAQGGKINDKDIAKMNQCTWSRDHFEKCSEQLEKMKVEKIYGDISYFSLLSKNMYFKVQLMKNKNFLVHFQRDEKRRAELFPAYFHMITQLVEIAEKRLKMLLAEKEQLREDFPEAMPDHIIEKIAYYLRFEKLEQCQHEYFMSFHANLKYSQVDKAKIL